VTYKMACADVVPGCNAVFEAESEEELLALVGAHANAEHAEQQSPGCEVVDQAISER
jgi:predicted small metal-binding protein